MPSAYLASTLIAVAVQLATLAAQRYLARRRVAPTPDGPPIVALKPGETFQVVPPAADVRCKHGFSVPYICPGDDRCPVEAAKPAAVEAPFTAVRFDDRRQWWETVDGKWCCKVPRLGKPPVKFNPATIMFVAADGTLSPGFSIEDELGLLPAKLAPAAAPLDLPLGPPLDSRAKPKVADEVLKSVRALGPLGPMVAGPLGPKLVLGEPTRSLDIAIDLPRPGTSDDSI